MNDRQTADIATALATVQQMRDELEACHEMIGQLKADLRAEQNKSTLLATERTEWRSDATLLRAKLVELATVQTNIGLLTRSADEISKTASSLLSGAAEADLLHNMERRLSTPSGLPEVRYEPSALSAEGAEELLNTLSSLSEPPRDDAGEHKVVVPTRRGE